MPKLSDSTADAVIVRWLKSPGESFRRGEGLIEVETDKATVVYEAEDDGTLDTIIAAEGVAVAVGEPIALVTNGGAADAETRRAPARPEPAGARPVEAAAGASRTTASAARQPNATPVARRTAVELGVSLHAVEGTGPGGRITVEDVTRAAAEGEGVAREDTGPVGKGETSVVELTTTQATIVRRMTEAATTPVFTVTIDVDASRIAELRDAARNRGDDVPSLNDFVVKAAAATLRELPRFNAAYVDGKVEAYSRVNVGVAVATDDALLVPVVFDADRKTLAEVAADTRRLADGARRRVLRPDELRDATFTVSNLGMLGVGSFTAIVDPPQAAILAVGAARRVPVEDGPDRFTFRDVMTVTLTCDHRVVYGADGARFLSRLRELLEEPEALVDGRAPTQGGQ